MLNLIVALCNLVASGFCWKYSKFFSVLNAISCVLNLALFIAQATA